MSAETALRSAQNLEKLEQLSLALGISGIRLMIDPEKGSASAESVIEDICRLMEYKISANAKIAAGTWLQPENVQDNCYPKF